MVVHALLEAVAHPEPEVVPELGIPWVPSPPSVVGMSWESFCIPLPVGELSWAWPPVWPVGDRLSSVEASCLPEVALMVL